ncbi:hypothetical protein Pla52o_27300 [Novipirellula galeiformis]|uniref:Uncharacterized protein n=1 Tax=Novipirellula galeiformis TaxID=2528004 RepID=A0A5C6CGI7_9BACT|nr:hypothetical protein Pla52o_27300 [Novipirellula galeiformis]
MGALGWRGAVLSTLTFGAGLMGQLLAGHQGGFIIALASIVLNAFFTIKL